MKSQHKTVLVALLHTKVEICTNTLIELMREKRIEERFVCYCALKGNLFF